MLRVSHVAYEGKHPPLEMGQLVFYTMGCVGSDLERPRSVVACAAGQRVPLDLHAPRTGHALFVQWYPYVTDAECRGRRVQRRAAYGTCEDLRAPPRELELPVLGEPGERLVLQLRWDTSPRDGWGARVIPAATRSETPATHTYIKAAAHYYAERKLRPCSADPNVPARGWPGSFVVTPAGRLPIATLSQASVALTRLVPVALLRHWCWLAATRLGLSRDVDRRDALIELACDVATTRLWTLAYQTDTSLGGNVIDDWAHISEAPDAGAAAYDCEDGSFDILSILGALVRTPPSPPHPGLMERVAAVARRYVFVQALGRMRSGDTVVWHSYVLGLDANSVARALGRSADTQPELPSVLIESTQYTTSLWSFDSETTARGAMLADDQNLSDVLHVKIPGSLMRSCGAQQYLQTFALFLPPPFDQDGAEVVLHTQGQDATYGVDTAALLANPTGCDWRVIPGWHEPALQRELAVAMARMPPWPVLSMPREGVVTNFAATGSVAFMRPGDYALLPGRWPFVDLPLYDTDTQTCAVRLVALEGRIDLALRPARKTWKP